MAPDPQVPVHFLNVEYFFRILYETIIGIRGPGLQTDLMSLLAHFWLIVTTLAFIISVALLGVFIYATLRYRQIIVEDEAPYRTIHDVHHAEEENEHHRWKHVLALIESTQESDWRQAIIEADIILFDGLDQAGYFGESVGEKLKSVDPRRLVSLQEAWDAHKVRNDIAHQGSQYVLTDRMAYRAIQQYEVVLKELGEIT